MMYDKDTMIRVMTALSSDIVLTATESQRRRFPTIGGQKL